MQELGHVVDNIERRKMSMQIVQVPANIFKDVFKFICKKYFYKVTTLFLDLDFIFSG